MKNSLGAILATMLLTACSVRAGNPGGGGEGGGARIDKRYPAGATSDTRVEIEGIGFGATQGTVGLGLQGVDVLEWSDTRIVVQTPVTSQTSCNRLRVVTVDDRASNTMPFVYGEHDVWIPWDEVPSPRSSHVAVWAGHEMIIWGGSTNTGARYNPASDTWVPISVDGAPTIGNYPAATGVWTGREMIVWGPVADKDYDFGFGEMSGGRYVPELDTWQTVSLDGAPRNGVGHTSVWTGTEMITWGGIGGEGGARYNPDTDTWVPIRWRAGAIDADRFNHTAVWTGDEMILWGGRVAHKNLDSSLSPTTDAGGHAYSPKFDTWRTISEKGAPEFRARHIAVWTGKRMLVWGGRQWDSVNPFGWAHLPKAGGMYDPKTDSWVPMSVEHGPEGRMAPQAVWTGQEMLVWSGDSSSDFKPMEDLRNDGGRFNPETNTWQGMTLRGAPDKRRLSTAVWSGSEMLVWGGQMWGGKTQSVSSTVDLRTGGRYDPIANRWGPIQSVPNEPVERKRYTANWTGSELLIWGGEPVAGGPQLETAARYNPATNMWVPISTVGAPAGRSDFTSVWTGRNLIVVGGYRYDEFNIQSGGVALPDGARYAPESDSWSPMPSLDAGRWNHTAVWTGSRMIIWGGLIQVPVSPWGPLGPTTLAAVPVSTGTSFDPDLGDWTPISTVNAPYARSSHSATWTGDEMIIYGGDEDYGIYPTGSRYLQQEDRWIGMPVSPLRMGSPHAAVWTGHRLLAFALDTIQMGATSRIGPLVAEYDRAGNQWTEFELGEKVEMSSQPAVIWTGEKAIVFGGVLGSKLSGFSYDPATHTVVPLNPGCGQYQAKPSNDAFGDDLYRSVWTGTKMYVWGPTGGLTYIP